MPTEEHKPAESSPAPASESAESRPAAAETEATISLAEVLGQATSEERKGWEVDGDERALYEKIEKRKAETAPVEAVKSEPEAAPGTPEERKPLTPEERSRRDKDRGDRRQGKYWRDEAVRERTLRAEAERKLAEAQGRKPEAAPGPVSDPARPKRPRMNDPKYAGDTGVDQYDSDMEKYELDLLAHDRKTASAQEQHSRTQVESAVDEAEEVDRRKGEWRKNESTLSDAYSDYAAIKAATIPKMDKDAPELAWIIAGLPEGPRLIYYFGKENPEAWNELLEMSADEAKLELGHIRRTLKPAPQPNKDTKMPSPVHAATGRDQTVEDPAEAAFKSGDHATYERLQTEKDLREWGMLT